MLDCKRADTQIMVNQGLQIINGAKQQIIQDTELWKEN